MQDALSALKGENYLNLETFKRDGDGVLTPLWFAHDGDTLVFLTDGRSYKCKRLRRNDTVRLAACNIRGGVHGEWFDAVCHVIEAPEAIERAHQALRRKYLTMRLTSFMSWLSGRKKHRLYYRISFPATRADRAIS